MSINNDQSCDNCSYGCLCYTAVSIRQILDDSANFIASENTKSVMITVANACTNYDQYSSKDELTISNEEADRRFEEIEDEEVANDMTNQQFNFDIAPPTFKPED